MFLSQGFFGVKGGKGAGSPGRDGITPTIGSNGNWFMGTKDTGVPARAAANSKAITNVALSNGVLTFTHADGAKHAVQLPVGTNVQGLKSEVDGNLVALRSQTKDIQSLKDQYGQLNTKVSDLTGAYTYDGDSVPAWPAQPKHAYFVHIHDSAARQINLPMPNPSGTIADGTTMVISNGHNTANINLSAITGQTIEGGRTITIPPSNHVMLVKNGSDWVKVMDVAHDSQSVPYVLTADKIAKALDHGQYNGAGSLKSLADGWWIIPVSNKTATGRPKGTTSDLIYFQQTTTPDAGKRFGIGMAFGQDSKLKDSVWVQYKNAGTWTDWIKEGGTADLTAVTASIAELKRGNQATLDELGQLKTAAGNLFAPTQDLFDKEANKLIDAKLAAYSPPVNPQVDQNKQDISTLKSSAVTEPGIEAALKAKGWGPLTKGGGGHSGTQPSVVLPSVWMMFDASLPTDISSATLTTNGEATLRKLGTGNERLWVLVEKSAAAKVSGIKVGTSFASKWDTRDLTINGQQYTGFYSAGGFTTFNKKVIVEFGG
ncbi:hypothetical protein VPHK250G1_0050 [Vibrio phage K250 g1]